MTNQNNPRGIRWNTRSYNHPERHEYIFLVIGDRAMIVDVTQRLQTQLEMVIEGPTNITKGTVAGTQYEAFGITSEVKPDRIRWKEVYDRPKKIKKTRELYPRQKQDGLANYIDGHIEQMTF